MHPDAESPLTIERCAEMTLDKLRVTTVWSTQSANKTTSRQLARLTKALATTNFEGPIDTEWTNPYLRKMVLQRRLLVCPQQQQQQQKPRRSPWRRACNALRVR